MNFSLVIPCYNEEKNLPILIDKYKKFLKKSNNELIIVNNGSVDNTNNFLRKLKKIKNIKSVQIKKNIGFGYGLKKGMFAANGDILIYSHADLEVDPNDILRAIEIFKKNNKNNELLIKGDRINKIKNNWSYLAIFFSYSLTVLSTILFRQKLYDIHGMPVLFHKNLLKSINYFPNDFSIDLAIYLRAKKKNYKIIRFPVNFNKKKRIYGEGSADTINKMIKSSHEQILQSIKILFKL